MRTALLRPLLVVLCMHATGLNAAPNDAVARLHQLFEREWQRDLEDDPRAATQTGNTRFNSRWADLSTRAVRSRDRHYRAVLRELQRYDLQQLPAAEQLNHDLFRRVYQDRVDQVRFNAHLRALDQLNYSEGVLTANEVAERIEFATVQDYRDWLVRLRGMDRYVDQTIALLREGVRTRNVQPRIIMERVSKQLQAQLVSDPRSSPFYAPFERIPPPLASHAEALQREAQKAIEGVVVPAFARLRTFLVDDYLPASRDTVGIWDTPDGAAFYRNRLEWFTTTRLSPDEIHAIGRREVARIREQMQTIIEQVGFRGSFEEFLQHLRTAPRFHHADSGALLNAYIAMTQRIDPLLPAYFGKLPRTPYGVRPIPAANAPDTTAAYYQPLSADGKRPGYFYVNLYRPEERPTYEIPVLTIHEAVPGHHLQMALAQELGELPKFRRDFEATAYVEGWALYAEGLGEEMGLYADPYDKFGQLTYEMWRAVRLVVDTGLHDQRWTREQAIEYFRANAPKSELDIVNEIDRYIAWPGQATAYKIGELTIQELRRRATDTLGEKFSLRDFHGAVLSTGAVPLDELERSVSAWIASKE